MTDPVWIVGWWGLEQITPGSVRYRNGRLITDVAVSPFRMSGFSVVVRHREGRPRTQVRVLAAHALRSFRRVMDADRGVGARASPQVREVRVVVSTLNVHGDLRQETLVGVYTLPLVTSNTPCHVDAPLDVRGNLVSIECMSSYGDMVRSLRLCVDTRAFWCVCVCVYLT